MTRNNMINLRPYQVESKTAVFREWVDKNKKTLLVLPTGTGKTVVFSKITEDCVNSGKRVLILAHRDELLKQAADKLIKTTGLECAFEKAGNTSKNSPFRVVVGSVQTMMRDKRLNSFHTDFFDTIIIDEAHHSIADSYQKVLNYFNNANILGVTATPDRGDMRNLGSYYDSLAYEYTLSQAIKDGYLSPIKALTIPLEVDISNVGLQSGDFKASDLDNALDPYLLNIAEEMVKHCKERKTVVFLPLVKTSQKFRDILCSAGFNATEVNGDSDNREQVLSDFDKGKYNVLCNSMLLTEGWDCPSVDCVIVLRPTKARSLYSQMVGRGTRLYKGKSDLLLLDFLWNTEKHNLCHPANLICENDEVAQRMTANINEADCSIDIIKAEEQAKEDIIKEREESLSKQLKIMRGRKGGLVDPLQFAMSIQSEALFSYNPVFKWEKKPPSVKQLKALSNMGILSNEINNAGAASKLINCLIERRNSGYATPKQIRCLESFGFKNVGTWKFEEANGFISLIANNNWTVPVELNPAVI